MSKRTFVRLVKSSALAALVAACAPSADLTMAPTAPREEPPKAAPGAPPPLESGRLPGTAAPSRYALSLIVDPSKPRFLGNVTIDVDVPKPTSAIVMHGRALTIASAEVMSGGVTVLAKASHRMAAGGREAPEELVLSLASPIRAGKAQIRVAYSGGLDQKLAGLYRVKDGDAYYAFTQLEPMEARRMMPCFDEPGFKVPFDVKVTVPKDNVAFANMNEVSRSPSEDGKSTTFTFATTPPLPTYLIAIAAGPLEVRDGPDKPVKIRVITTKGKTHLGELALEATAGLTTLLADYFDRPFPYPKLDLVAVPEFGYGAMENAGLITFREDTLLLDPVRASVTARRGMAEIVAHEVAHHWFGDLVTMTWWNDLWLNEGFATWMEAKVVDMWRPAMEARLEELAWRGGVMEDDALESARAVRQPVSTTSEAYEAFDGITYAKGGAVLGMLESYLGERAFRDGVRAYIKAHEHKNAAASDMLRALSAASGKDVEPIASTFLDQPGVPLVRAELACEKGQAPTVKLAQSRYRAHPAPAGGDEDAALWKIPVCVTYEGSGGAPVCTLMEGKTAALTLAAPAESAPSKPGAAVAQAGAKAAGGDPEGKPSAALSAAARCPKWIHPNAGQAGYYRYALPKAELSSLIGAAKDLDIRARVGLLNNAWALVQSGDMEADALLDMVTALKGDKHRLVIDQIIGALWRVSHTFVDDATRPVFRAYVSSLLLPIAKELGWDAKKGEGEDRVLLRRSVLGALATLAEDPWLFPEAEKRAAAYLKDPRSVDQDIASIALRVASRRAGEKRWDELVAALGAAETPEQRKMLLGALGSFSSPVLVRRSLDLMLADRVRMHDGLTVMWTAASWPEARPRVLAWQRESFEELKKKLPSYILSRLARGVEMVCEKGTRDEAATFFKAALAGVEGADRPLSQALEASGLCIDLRAREGARVKAKLAGGGGKRAAK